MASVANLTSKSDSNPGLPKMEYRAGLPQRSSADALKAESLLGINFQGSTFRGASAHVPYHHEKSGGRDDHHDHDIAEVLFLFST